ncbi:MAG: hypothetical protein HYV07_24030 [Deltaproteobacteria bacterium]|nr:hypothetical protein [Deltaproteobacteria bacterium]
MLLAALATFEGKKAAGTLPAGVGARYLLGIARNKTHKREGLAVAEALLRERLEARDRTLAVLTKRLDAIKATSGVLDAIIDELTFSPKAIDRIFWTDALSKYISGQPQSQLKASVKHTADRLDAVERLVEKVIPLDAA